MITMEDRNVKDKIKINDIDTYYKLQGLENEKTIVFIHGLSDDLNYWSKLEYNFSKEYKTLSYDLRGHGKTDLGTVEVNYDTYQNDLYNLLKKLDIKEAVFVGLSLGGNIALNFAIKHPEMTKGLILMSAFSEMTPELRVIFKEFEKSISHSYLSFYDNIIRFCLPENMLKEYKDALNYTKYEKSKTANIKGILCGIVAGYDCSLTNELYKINCPTLILTGENDDITPINLQKRINENIKDSKMIIFPNTKHNILINENINKIIKLMEELLKNSY